MLLKRSLLKGIGMLITGIFPAITFGQLLSWTLAFPADSSSVTITCNMTKGNQGLKDYADTSDVYVHAGVITSSSTLPTDWRYVKFNQDFHQPNPALKAVHTGSNLYRFTIANIRNYFGVPAAEKILKVAILFRNGNGTAVQRNGNGNDMYVPVYTDSLAARFVLPPFQPLYNPLPETIQKSVGDTLAVNYIANRPAALSLYLDGTRADTATLADSLPAKIVITGSGNHRLIAYARAAGTTRSDTIDFFVPEPVTFSPLPAGTEDGINYEPGDSSVVLVLYAPKKTNVSVVGDFNNWTTLPAYQMKETPDSLRFWLRIAGLTPGMQYAYQYLVDGNLKIADPYTEEILDPDNDPYISTATYPNLKSYPTGKTTGIVSLLQPGAPAYAWHNNNFSRPDKRDLSIYELLVRDFVATHDYKTIRDTLNYFKRLGVNAIELMPVMEFEGNSSWGYNPSFYFAPDKYYGPASSLKELIDSCHSKGIAVILDIVLNHSFGSSPLVQLYFDPATGKVRSDNPWYNVAAPHQAIDFGYDFNHESAATQYFVDRVLQHWLLDYKVDGFRFDFTKGFTQKVTTTDAGLSALDTSRVNILKRINNYVQSQSPGAYMILEHLCANDEEKLLADAGMLLWGNENYSFNEATMGWVGSSDLSWAVHAARGFNQPYLLSYMESHDEERLMYKNLRYGNMTSGYTIKGDTATSLKRQELATAFYLAMPGPRMIWEFGELGYDYSRCYLSTNGEGGDCNSKTDPRPIRWDYLQDARRRELFNVYSALLKLRQDYPDLFESGSIHYDLTGAFKSMSVTQTDLGILVIGNFDVAQQTGSVTFPAAGTWYDYFTGATVTATGSSQSFTLAPGQYRFFTSKKISDSAVTGLSNLNRDPNPFGMQVNPNPVSGYSSVIYTLPENGAVSLAMMDLAGRILGVFTPGFQGQGRHVLPLDKLTGGRALATGPYLLRVVSGNRASYCEILK